MAFHAQSEACASLKIVVPQEFFRDSKTKLHHERSLFDNYYSFKIQTKVPKINNIHFKSNQRSDKVAKIQLAKRI